MITVFELLSLALNGNLENDTYEVIPAKRNTLHGHEVSFEDMLCNLVGHSTDFEDFHVCVGTRPNSEDLGYLVKRVREIPTARNLLGPAKAIYEVDGTDNEEGCRYYAVWAITN